jgi:hypothetical protein
MARLNLNVLWLWPLLGLFVALMMSFQDPFRVALVGLLLSLHGPVWRSLHRLQPAAATTRTSPASR